MLQLNHMGRIAFIKPFYIKIDVAAWYIIVLTKLKVYSEAATRSGIDISAYRFVDDI